jgi:phage/plasmid-like protein (TIGR03299 family)
MDAVETMAYRADGGLPWHGLGEPVSNDISVDEMLKVADLDWTVSKRPLYFRKQTEGEKIAMRIAPGEYGLVRDTDEAFFDTVGENWTPTQNRDAVEFFTRFVKAGDMQMETMGSLKGGRFIWALARIGESFKIGNGIDETRAYLLLSSPHQFGFSLTAALTPVRVVCWNTITAALGHRLDGKNKGGATFRMTHARAFDDDMKAKAEQALGLAHAEMQTFSHTAEMLSGVGAKVSDVMDYYHDVMQIEREQPDPEGEDTEVKINSTIKRFADSLTFAPGQDIPTAKGTWWGAFNSVTYTVDHELCLTSDTRLHSAWYGYGAGLKRRALELAVNYAEKVAA